MSKIDKPKFRQDLHHVLASHGVSEDLRVPIGILTNAIVTMLISMGELSDFIAANAGEKKDSAPKDVTILCATEYQIKVDPQDNNLCSPECPYYQASSASGVSFCTLGTGDKKTPLVSGVEPFTYLRSKPCLLGFVKYKKRP